MLCSLVISLSPVLLDCLCFDKFISVQISLCFIQCCLNASSVLHKQPVTYIYMFAEIAEFGNCCFSLTMFAGEREKEEAALKVETS